MYTRLYLFIISKNKYIYDTEHRYYRVNILQSIYIEETYSLRTVISTAGRLTDKTL